MKKRLYIKVSRDRYELPEAVADNVRELSEMVGANPITIKAQISNLEHGRIKATSTPYRRIVLDGEEDENEL